MLDLSSAFYTLKHDILLHRLKGRFGIKGLAYQWFETYLKNRQHKVVVNGVESPVHTPDIGVPQGSVVGPILFTMYSSPLEDIIKAHNMSGITMNPGLKNVSICSQQENCQISLNLNCHYKVSNQFLIWSQTCLKI